MKKLMQFTLLIAIAMMFVACGGKTEVAWKNGNTGTADMGNITWQADSKKWNELSDRTSSSATGSLKVADTSDSKEVSSTTSAVSVDVLDSTDTATPWLQVDKPAFSLEENKSQTYNLTATR